MLHSFPCIASPSRAARTTTTGAALAAAVGHPIGAARQRAKALIDHQDQATAARVARVACVGAAGIAHGQHADA